MPNVLSNLIGTRAKEMNLAVRCAVSELSTFRSHSQVNNESSRTPFAIQWLWNDLKLIVIELLFSENEEDIVV